MSRVIKFRFYSKSMKQFVKPDDSIFVGALKDKNMAVMQFTGLVDKKGKEIFEGDILEVDGNERTVKVVWHDRAGMWDTDVVSVNEKEKAFESLKNYQWRLRTEIVGSIYA